MFNFGTGWLFGNPLSQNLATNPTPQYFGTVQEVSIEIGATIKELRGNLQFPDDTAIADKKLTGKVSFGRIEIPVFNQLFFADSYVAGVTAVQPRESHAIPATPYQVTPTPPGSGTYATDLGVAYAATGAPLTKVTGTPTTGQYAVAAGVYTFAAADTGLSVLISYTYTLSSTGNTLTVNNQLQGYGPQFEMWLGEPYAGQGNGIHLYACKSGKLGAPRKRDDYTIIEMDFECFANAAGKVFDWFQVSA